MFYILRGSQLEPTGSFGGRPKIMLEEFYRRSLEMVITFRIRPHLLIVLAHLIGVVMRSG